MAEVKAVETEEDDEIDLGEIFYLLWRHILQIIVLAVIGGVLAVAAVTVFVTPKYTATSRMYVLSTSSDSSTVDWSDVQISSQLKSDCQELLTSRTILEDVINKLGLDYSPSQLKKMITVSNPTDTRILNIDVESTDPKEASDIANAVAENGKTYLPEVMKTQDISVFENAEVPTSKSSPSVKKDGVIGALVFALIYIVILVVKHLMNDTLVTADDVTKYLGVQPLAVVPEHAAKKKNRKRADK